VRELLMNIVKHATVKRARVVVEAESDRVVIMVQDHGRGFDPSTLPPGIPGHHFGLQSVRERITATGGTFVIDSTVGRGASITVTLPIHSWSESEELRAASSIRQDRVRMKSAEDENQQSLPL